jgi:hypothetical protein
MSALHLLGLPVFGTVEELAELIRVDQRRLRLLTLKAERFYCTYRIPKRNSGWRKINSPCKDLKAVQAWILRNILDRLSISPHATAYAKGSRLLNNVSPHSSNRYFLSLDIENFFPSIHKVRVRKLFEDLGYPKQAAYILMRLCSYFSRLPQGAVTSPALSNLICRRLDRRIAGLVSRRNIVFTRYADDITFSTNNRNALPRILPLVRRILRDEGFEPNEKKTRLLGPRTRCLITGLVKNSSAPTFGIGKKKKAAMRAVMHNLRGRNSPFERYPTEASIQGWLWFLRNVDSVSYAQMSRYWDALKTKYPTLSNNP